MKNVQNALGNYCKTGVLPPEISSVNNISQYRNLIISTGYQTIKKAFPIFYHLIGEDNFLFAVEEFYAKHKAKTPILWKLPYEFYEFFVSTEFKFKTDYIFLEELLLFEWLEIEVFMMEDQPIEPYQKIENIETASFIIHPELIIIPLKYPLHKKKAKEISAEDKGQYIISLHRDIHSKQVKFNEISFPLFLFLEKSLESSVTYKDLVTICSKFSASNEEIETYAREMINFCCQEGIILGETIQ